MASHMEDSEGVSGRPMCALYVHVPFCQAKCGYCDFYSVEIEAHDTEALVERLVRELGARLAGSAHTIGTCFVGGGTPTALPLEPLATLLRGIGACVPVDELQEFTVEANPATVDEAKAALLVESGVTRVSIGAQSFSEDELTTLERLHTPDDIAPSVAALRRNGLKQLNLDLIFGIPGQTLETWSASLRRAVELEPDHIACYGLTYEPGTRLAALHRDGRITPCGENIETDMFLHAMDMLADSGFRQYEISNFARPGCECRHNLIYWRNGPYIGVGPSAVGCVDGRRSKNVPDVQEYMRMVDALGHAETDVEIIDAQTLMTEMIMLQLRLAEGLSVAAFRERIGIDPLTIMADTLKHLAESGLVDYSNTRIALTRNGWLVSNAVMGELVYACGGG